MHLFNNRLCSASLYFRSADAMPTDVDQYRSADVSRLDINYQL